MKKRKKRAGKTSRNCPPRRDANGYLMPSGRDDSLLPFYGEGRDSRFEQICVDIAEKEPGIECADRKNQHYRKQYGVDVEAFDTKHHRPALVISCKCYKKIKTDDLKTWSHDFLIHWDDYWKGKGVRRFVLAVTVELNKDKLQDAIRAEKARFRSYGINYECWGTRQLTS